VGGEASTACRRLVAISRSAWTPSSRINSAVTMAFPGNFSLHPVEAFRTHRSGRCVTRPLTKGSLGLVRQRETGIKVMRVRLGLLLAALALQLAASLQAIAEDPHLGVIEYELSCMSCHGLDGHGDGPRARTLQTKPADLTKIARANNGEFPTAKVANIIDGRAIVAAHGPRDMPVWGDRYRVRVKANESDSTIETRARAHIAALVQYLKKIQER
jgi:hypothetical protein